METEEIPKEILNAIDSFNVRVRWRISWIWTVLCAFDLTLIPF
jgi:hypothetical protein